MKKAIGLRALSIAQPWAECIVGQGKNVENRSWDTHRRGYLAIHASRSREPGRFEACLDLYRIRLDPDELDFGAIVGFAELAEVITEDEVTAETRRWFGGEYGFVLRNVVRLKRPVPVKGALNFWALPTQVQNQALAQLSASYRAKVLKRPLV